ASEWTKRAFNASLALVDGTGAAKPYLADALPQLNTDTWKVTPDGKMETMYRLKANLTWHDGTPLTADDFVFANQMYVTPGLGAYKLVIWEPGVQLEGQAFDGHALGRPKTGKVVIRIIQDENTVMSNVIAGTVDIAGDTSIRFEHAAEIKRQLGEKGVALMRP